MEIYWVGAIHCLDKLFFRKKKRKTEKAIIDKNRKYDVLTIGRSSIDLYSNDIGADFTDITSFNAYVGGSPTNIAVGCQRLGLKSALLTAFGQDKVGDFIKKYLIKEHVDISYSPTVIGMRTSAVILGVQPPDVFPLVYYRENAADLQITTDDINLIDFRQFKIVEISATSLSKNPSRSSVLHAAKKAKESDCFIILDLDFRLDQWISIADYQHYMSAVAPYIDLVVGTKEEFLAAAKNAGTDITVVDQQMSNPEIVGDLEKALVYMMNLSDAKLIVKNGSQGCLLITPPESEKVVIHGFPVTVLNILGAGDAFASGLIYGLCHSWPMAKACKMANACGAIMVTKHGCANFMPTLEEVNNFVDQHGGWNESN